MERWLGCYGALNNEEVDFQELMDLYPDFTGYKFFLTACGTQNPKHPLHPFVYNKIAKRFEMKSAVINPAFINRLKQLAVFFAAGKSVVIVFDNRYYQRKWVKNHVFKRHFLRDNDIGIDWGGSATQQNWTGQAKPLYDSITFGGGVTFHWKKWIDIDEKRLQFKFADVGEIGTALSEYRKAVAETLVPIVKQHNGRLYIMGRNEERAGVEGDRSELTVYEKEVFEAAGVKKWGARFNRIINRDTDTKLPRLHDSIIGPYAGRLNNSVGCLGALHEVHLKNNAMRQTILGWGYNNNKTVWSSDGWDEGSENFITGNRKLYQSNAVYADILFEEAVIPNPEPVVNIAANLRKAAPIYKGITG